jgi:hypothetical protein
MSGTAPYYPQAFSPLLPPGLRRRGRRRDPLPGARPHHITQALVVPAMS